MTITEKISLHFNKCQKNGSLIPGDKLPTYAELCNMFNASYVSVQRAFKSLEQSGQIKIVHGIGSFLCGQEKLNVELYLPQSTFDFCELKTIIDDIVSEKKLYLDITLKDSINEGRGIQNLNENRKVVIAEVNSWLKISGAQLDYSAFADYEKVKQQFKTYNHSANNLEIPFYTFTSQGAINPKILKQIGFENKIDSLNNFSWWDEYIEKCSIAKLVPAAKKWEFHALWHFKEALTFGIPLLMNERGTSKDIVSLPFFNTASGRKILQIFRDHASDMSDRCAFMDGKTGIRLDVGSWISVQYEKKFGMGKNDFRIIPYTFKNQNVCSFWTHHLQTFVHSSINQDEKRRIWELIKNLVSKKIQRRITALSGSVSVRKDMKIEDHSWADREDYRAFFPQKNDILISLKIFPIEVISALSAIYEQYEFFNASENNILKCMDYKIKSILNPT